MNIYIYNDHCARFVQTSDDFNYYPIKSILFYLSHLTTNGVFLSKFIDNESFF